MRAGLFLIILLVFLPACDHQPEQRLSVGSRFGGIFNLNETEPLRSIFPLCQVPAGGRAGCLRFDEVFFMANKPNYPAQMDQVFAALGDERPPLLLHACCGPSSSSVLDICSSRMA